MPNEKGPRIKKKPKCKNCEGKGTLKKGDKVVKCQRCGGTGGRGVLSATPRGRRPEPHDTEATGSRPSWDRAIFWVYYPRNVVKKKGA